MISLRSPSFQFRPDLVMDSPSGLQNELKDSLPVIVSDIVMDASSALHNELKLHFLSHCRVS